MGVILASKSPRRRELLSMLGIDFDVITEEVDETINEALPLADEIMRLSRLKAAAVADKASDTDIVIAADTVVSLDGKVFGKPKDSEDAKRMLGALSGKTHKVVTGVTVTSGGRRDTRSMETDVTFRNLTQTEIDEYVKTGDPLDKAGAYALQGISSIFVRGISGDHFNVYGLPLSMLSDMLRGFGVKILGESRENTDA